VEHFITTYGIAAVFVLMVLESACIPIPSEVTMLVGGAMSAGAFAGSKPSLVLVIAAGVVGNVIGSYIAWAVGRYGGTPLIMKFGKYILLREHDLDKAERWFDNRGAVSVLVGRLLPVIRTFISLPAGIARMNPVKFGVYTTLGCIPWTAALAIVGYQVGGNYKHIADDFQGPTYIIAVIVLVAALFLAYRHIKRSRAAAGIPGGPGPQNEQTLAVDRRGARHRRGGGSSGTRGVPNERPGSERWTDDRDRTRARR